MQRHFPSLRETLHTCLAAALLLVLVRTFFLLGLVVPVTVAGSSMAPAFRGPHKEIHCHHCQHTFAIGADQTPPHGLASCPQCGNQEVEVRQAVVRSGERLRVDRTAYLWRLPSRWETVVFRCPDNEVELCVKRIVGLPGDSIELLEGDILVNGRVSRKSLDEQRQLRKLVHREQSNSQRWQMAANDLSWKWSKNTWQHRNHESGEFSWLRYQHPDQGPVLDDFAYNQRVSRQLNPVRDIMLEVIGTFAGDGLLVLTVDATGRNCRATFDVGRRVVRLEMPSGACHERAIDLNEFSGRAAAITFSRFDRNTLLAINNRVLFTLPESPGHTLRDLPDNPRLALGMRGISAEIRELSVWQDAYYEVRPSDRSAASGRWQVGPQGLIVLGDNSAISHDSRSWPRGPELSRNLIVGKPL